MNSRNLTTMIAALVVGVMIFFLSAFIVDETELAIITRFGKVIRQPIFAAGLNFRWPFFDKVHLFPKNLREWDGETGELPTLNKTYIWVNTFARWRINDPVLFYQRAVNMDKAQRLMGNILDSEVKNAIANQDLIEAVRNSNRKMASLEELSSLDSTAAMQGNVKTSDIKIGRDRITKTILERAKPKIAELGIDLVDVKIKRINYREDVQESVYDRMIAERTQIVERFRSEGKGEAQKILGEKEKKLKEIQSEAYKTAQIIMGQADARATRISAEAYSKDPEFYSFVKTLSIYTETLDDTSSVVLSTDTDFFKYLKGYSGR
ncbi:MAG: protease modulator HflC [Thermodesulfobacteriota bacterium]